MKIAVLTSRENFVWHSMQEIIPYLEHIWKTLPKDQAQVEIINIDNLNFAEIIKKILESDRVVSTCFNFKMCKVLKFARLELGLKTPFIVHVHNMATIAFWPFRLFGGKDLFIKSDVFIGSCERDLQTLKLIAPEAQAVIIPFFWISSGRTIAPKLKKSFENILFIGRISPQKNLHILIYAYFLLKKHSGGRVPHLQIYGKEDHLGAPNMNIKNQNYLSFLEGLVKELKLQDEVEFMGHRSRDEIKLKLSTDVNLVVSPSLHSDENFGMAILQALTLNNDVVISDWGGHGDFKKHFSEQVELVPIRHSSWGPVLLADDLFKQLNKCLSSGLARPYSNTLPNHYLLSEAHLQCSKALQKPENAIPLQFSQVADEILQRAKCNTKEKQSTQIFNDFQDSLFHKVAQTYMNGESSEIQNEDLMHFSEIEQGPLPWVHFENEQVVVKDPHRGTHCPECRSGERAQQEIGLKKTGHKVETNHAGLDT